jgi:hypothetical protein
VHKELIHTSSFVKLIRHLYRTDLLVLYHNTNSVLSLCRGSPYEFKDPSPPLLVGHRGVPSATRVQRGEGSPRHPALVVRCLDGDGAPNWGLPASLLGVLHGPRNKARIRTLQTRNQVFLLLLFMSCWHTSALLGATKEKEKEE